MKHEKVIIIGGGPAGIACAVQLKRYGIDPLIIEKDSIGGLVKNAWRLDNFPGYPDGIGGNELVIKLNQHLERFDIRYQKNEIRKLKPTGNGFECEGDGLLMSAEYVVIATGTLARNVFCDINGKHNDRIFTEVFPLREKKGKDIAIIGAGDAAFDYAMTLSLYNKVYIFNRGEEIKCIPALLEIAQNHENISYSDHAELLSIEVKNNRIYPQFKDMNVAPDYSADYIIFATGRDPELRLFSPELINMQEALEQDGLLYVIGDVKNGMVRQSSVAIGDGVKAAMAIKDKINS